MEQIERSWDLENYFPRDVAYSNDKKVIYDRLLNDTQSPFKGLEMQDVFLYSAIFGFLDGKPEILKERIPQIPISAFPEKSKSLLLAMAIAHSGDIDVLFDVSNVIKIVEQFANRGIILLEDLIKRGQIGDPEKRIESAIRTILKQKQGEPSSIEFEILKTGKSMSLISAFETNLRYLIKSRLSKMSADWENERIPDKVMVKRWMDNKKRAEKAQEFFLTESDLIDFSELGDLYEIIKWKKNWNDVFKSIFGDRDIFDSDMRQVIMIRPDIAHSRGATDIQEKKLEAIIEHRNQQIEKSLI